MIKVFVVPTPVVDVNVGGPAAVSVNVGPISAGGGWTTYPGPYTVDPDFVRVTLPTQGKNMLEDVTVNAIEVQRVSNPTGGKTVYIGGIIDG